MDSPPHTHTHTLLPPKMATERSAAHGVGGLSVSLDGAGQVDGAGAGVDAEEGGGGVVADDRQRHLVERGLQYTGWSSNVDLWLT